MKISKIAKLYSIPAGEFESFVRRSGLQFRDTLLNVVIPDELAEDYVARFREYKKEMEERQREEQQAAPAEDLPVPAGRVDSAVFYESDCFGRGEGRIVYEDGTFTVWQKGADIRLLFGILGSALTSGTEMGNFHVTEIRDFSLRKQTIRIGLKNGKEIYFNPRSIYYGQFADVLRAAAPEV